MSAKTYRYFLENENYEGWNLIILDQEGSECHLFISGDYGRYIARFYTNQDIREFLVDIEKDYLLRSIAQPSVYNGEKTLKAVKEHILEWRRDGSFSREKAREEWNMLEEFDNLSTKWDFHDWIQATSIQEPWEFEIKDYTAGAISFVDRALPRLKEVLKKELQTVGNGGTSVKIDPRLKKGDKVIMHTCGEARKYTGRVWTCETDEFMLCGQRVVMLAGYRGAFAAKFLRKTK